MGTFQPYVKVAVYDEVNQPLVIPLMSLTENSEGLKWPTIYAYVYSVKS